MTASDDRVEDVDPLLALDERVEEISPHQRAYIAVLKVWGTLSIPLSMVAALALGTWLAWQRPGHINPLILMATYFFAGMPTMIGLSYGQHRLQRAIARRILRELDAPVRGALSGAQSSAAFQTTQASNDAQVDDAQVNDPQTGSTSPSPSPRPPGAA